MALIKGIFTLINRFFNGTPENKILKLSNQITTQDSLVEANIKVSELTKICKLHGINIID